MMDLPKLNNRSLNDPLDRSSIAESASVLLNIKKKKVRVKKSKVKNITRGLAEIAFSMGETNDIEEYSEEMADDIYEALKRVEEGYSGNAQDDSDNNDEEQSDSDDTDKENTQ